LEQDWERALLYLLAMRLTIIAFAVLVIGLGTAAADKKHHRYVGIHPITKAHGGGMCHIEAPHMHVYAPVDVKVNFRVHDGYHYFVGDPVAYQWDGPKTSYYGHHPVPVHVLVGDEQEDIEYCYFDGPHHHAWAPPPGMEVKLHAGAYWYTGDFPEAYVKGKVTYDPIDVVYEPIVYTRPVVVVEAPPPGWYGIGIVDIHAHGKGRGRGHARGHGHGHVDGVVGVEVVAPAVHVEVGLPSVHIGVGAGVVVGGGGHRHHRGGKHKHKKWKRGRR
jgi:hypothetical protein